MTQEQFLNKIYGRISFGTPVLIPNRQTEIIEIKASGDIVYLVANAYKKVLTRGELEAVYQRLMCGSLKKTHLRDITTRSRTCNVSTIIWVLNHCALASQGDGECWIKTW